MIVSTFISLVSKVLDFLGSKIIVFFSTTISTTDIIDHFYRMLYIVTHLADKVMEMSAASIFSAFWTFSIMGLLTWAIIQDQTSRHEEKTYKKFKHILEISMCFYGCNLHVSWRLSITDSNLKTDLQPSEGQSVFQSIFAILLRVGVKKHVIHLTTGRHETQLVSADERLC